MGLIMEETIEQEIAIARRWFGNRAGGAKVACKQREFDYKWDMLKLVADPTLTSEQLADIKARNLPIPTKWVTVEVVEPYIVEGIKKSLNREEQNGK
jgi:hypothetical protein